MSETRPEYGKDEIRRKIAELRGWTPFAIEMGGIPDWPINIQDAWDLVEEMKNAGLMIDISNQFVDDKEFWNVYIYVRLQNTHTWKLLLGEGGEFSDTAPLAICLAWITWKENKG